MPAADGARDKKGHSDQCITVPLKHGRMDYTWRYGFGGTI